MARAPAGHLLRTLPGLYLAYGRNVVKWILASGRCGNGNDGNPSNSGGDPPAGERDWDRAWKNIQDAIGSGKWTPPKEKDVEERPRIPIRAGRSPSNTKDDDAQLEFDIQGCKDAWAAVSH